MEPLLKDVLNQVVGVGSEAGILTTKYLSTAAVGYDSDRLDPDVIVCVDELLITGIVELSTYGSVAL
jgi:hypothetical protein